MIGGVAELQIKFPETSRVVAMFNDSDGDRGRKWRERMKAKPVRIR